MLNIYHSPLKLILFHFLATANIGAVLCNNDIDAVSLPLVASDVTATMTDTQENPFADSKSSNVRKTQQQTSSTLQPYYLTRDLGVPNVDVAIGNPLKGLAGGPRYSQKSPLPNSVPSAIEFYNVGLDEIMIGDNLFNWTIHDKLLQESASRKMHAVLSVFIHWPGRELRLPPHLKDIPLFDTKNGGKSPNYGDSRLLTALQQFITAWGKRSDGDTRIAAIHVGLLGFWGEGHTYPDSTLVPESSKVSVAQWYRQSFTTTQIQARYPGPNAAGFGLYDGSLAYSTLDGAANGGKNVSWFTYRQILDAKQTNMWKSNIMGGETRPELQKIIFTDTYPARTEYHQDYKECIDALHLSYALHHDAFQNGGYTGNMLQNANKIHAYMGYAFFVSKVAAYPSTLSTTQAVDVSVDITQFGVAPFYYDLKIVLECGNGVVKSKIPGVNTIVDKGEFKTFTFQNIPATRECLEKISLSLESSYAYMGRPILFAQGIDGKVSLSIPLPAPSVVAPVATAPIPIQRPISVPVRVPVSVPVPVAAPVRVAPVSVPVPVAAPVRVAPVSSPTKPRPVPVRVPVTVPTPIVVASPMRVPAATPINPTPIRVPVPVPTIGSIGAGGVSNKPVFRLFFESMFPKLQAKDENKL